MVISNSTPLIYLADLGDFELLPNLFGPIAIPDAVREEVTFHPDTPVAQAVEIATASWLSVVRVVDRGRCSQLGADGIHLGESEAIVLALESDADALLIDDGDGVHIARAAGINFIRTSGIYRLAKQCGMISKVRPKLDALRKAGFWLSELHYRMILESLGE